MTDERPNIVLVTVDSLRADHCSFMGYERETTPTLDAMAEEGLVFENAIAPGPSTPESMPVVFTGQWPVDRVGDASSGLEKRRRNIRAHMRARDTLPERLERLGYSTAAFTPNPFTSRHFGFDAGFDHFQDFMDGKRGGLYERVFRGFLEGSSTSSAARMLLNLWQREEVFKPWESYYDEVVAWAEAAEEPFFCWVFLMDAHNPYLSDGYRSQARWKEVHANVEFWRQSHETPFSETVHERLVRAYDDAVRYADAFLARLRADGVTRDAVTVVHGDHGEAFGEHGSYGHEPHLHRENLHVPLIVHGVGSGRVTDTFPLRRLPRTVVDLAHGRDVDVPEYALARTSQGEASVLYTKDGYYIRDDAPGDGASPITGQALRPGHREQSGVVRAAASLSAGGRV